MVRNLVREKDDRDERDSEERRGRPRKEEGYNPINPQTPTPSDKPAPVQVITEAQYLNIRLDRIEQLLLEGFKQVGVKFPEEEKD